MTDSLFGPGRLIAIAALVSLLGMPAHADTITVNTLVDSIDPDSNCSLREAITAANNNSPYFGCPTGSGADVIDFSVTGTIVLTSDLPNINEALTITGPGAENLIIDGDELYKMFYFNFAEEGEQFRLERMSLIDGLGQLGEYAAVHVLDEVNLEMDRMVISGMRLTSTTGGAAIGGQAAVINIRRCSLVDNATNDGSGGAMLILGGIEATIEDSTFENNVANGTISVGGAIIVGSTGTLTIRRSTFSGNSAGDRGGAIALVASSAVATIESSTFVNNTAVNSGGALDINAGTVNISNSLFAFNMISGSPVGDPTININQEGSAVINTLGYNAVTDNSGASSTFPAGLPNGNNDYVGTAMNTLNPQINTLADNGGPTRTHALMAASSLIDAGSCTGEPHDQRGYSNPAGGGRIVNGPPANADDGCDIGAYEAGAQLPPYSFADGFENPPND